jgi:hypothetical protein
LGFSNPLLRRLAEKPVGQFFHAITPPSEKLSSLGRR